MYGEKEKEKEKNRLAITLRRARVISHTRAHTAITLRRLKLFTRSLFSQLIFSLPYFLCFSFSYFTAAAAAAAPARCGLTYTCRLSLGGRSCALTLGAVTTSSGSIISPEAMATS